jgi:ribonuclease-3 family protein
VIPQLSPAQARNYSALQLAFIGDAVYNLYTRLNSLKEGKGLRAMHLGTTRRVNAVAQSQALSMLDNLLTEEERDIVRRGRNAHPRHTAPRSATSAQYSASTGFEALIGFHFLTGQTERLNTFLNYLYSEQAV